MARVCSLRLVVLTLIVWLPLSVCNTPQLAASQDPNNCETNILRLDIIHSKAGDEGLVIAIARLGIGENSRKINQRRLYNINRYLREHRGRSAKTIITAQGLPVRGRGRVDIYVSGRLVDSFVVGRGEDIPVGACEGDDYDFYPQKSNRSRH
jgi:hypothetical protein